MYTMLHTLITSYDVLFYAGKNRHQYADHYVHPHLNIHMIHKPTQPSSTTLRVQVNNTENALSSHCFLVCERFVNLKIW
jgi:hypothetical protein